MPFQIQLTKKTAMRKIIMNAAISLDGKIEGPNGEYDWCFADQDYGMKKFLQGIDSIFYGRKSYEVMMKEGKGANPFKGFKTYLFSNSMPEGDGYMLVKGDTTKSVKDILNLEGKNIWLFGGAELTQSLLALDLVDELSLALHPIALGQGKDLFAGLHNRLKLKLISADTYDTGLLILKYQVVKSA